MRTRRADAAVTAAVFEQGKGTPSAAVAPARAPLRQQHHLQVDGTLGARALKPGAQLWRACDAIAFFFWE